MSGVWARSSDDRFAGILLAAASVLAIVGMAHHPVGAAMQTSFFQNLHAALILTAIVSAIAMARLAARRGLERLINLSGLVAFGLGAMANILAGVINGFVTPALLAREAGEAALAVCWELNQALAYGAVYLTSAALVLWGADMVSRERGLSRVLGLAGLLAGLGPSGLLMAGVINMEVSGAFIAYASQAAFGVFAAVELMRRAKE